MERTAEIISAKKILGTNFIGIDELLNISDRLKLKIPSEVPAIPYQLDELERKKDDYILILGVPSMEDGKPINLNTLRNLFGINPDISEPCFYNQDWYLRENFIVEQLELKWMLIRKNILENSRGINPDEVNKNHTLPSAIQCAYTFFVCWFFLNECLWENDFIWCNNFDHNGDRIYVGKYHDIEGINKNGFSIHRHLALRKVHSAIDLF